MSYPKDAIEHPVQIEHAVAKDLYSVSSGQSAIPSEVPRHGIDAEIAQFFAETDKPIYIDPETNRRLRWMVHKRVLVVMVVTYFAQTLDKGTINFASIMGIQEDTHLHGQQYAWLTTCVYIAILAWEFPANRLLQRLPVAKFLGFNITAWGAVLACTAACHNFGGLITVRTLLGIFECVCQPAFVFLSTMWYTREEQPLIIGSFYSMNGFQQCVGGLVAYGIAHIHGGALKNWQILFTLLGCLTVVWGLFVTWWLPDSPIRAKCWSVEDRHLIAERVRANNTGLQNKEFKTYQALEALRDPTVWMVTLISFTNALPTGGLGAFSNLIIKAFGYTTLQTYLLAIAQGSIIMFFLFSAAWLSKRYKQRLLCAFIYTLPNIAGTIVFLTVPTNQHTKVGLLLAFYCMQGFGAVAVLNLAVMSGNVAGRTKQVMANSLVFIAWAVGNAIGPQVFRANDAPRYTHAFISHMVLYGIQCSTIVALRIHLMRMNVLKRRAQGKPEIEVGGATEEEHLENKHAFDDLTDKENPDFRYVY
ncbi:MFS general substrate transporter [Punctularia strigosozonata HHB-11173 SS5]|uniref:MFS general substrate transporter n=1 Tax=Punctularia strigosozonata (strain HHB-11173) TaxID=741275 RepID=UPI0004416491|nr:MFS general substrate transporter [Punctularia strigosozonata HHB-11173 SS5]EIN10598.1 MFS general substrate transporter [Punctularia strigosozonata HHB-11173 SS5]